MTIMRNSSCRRNLFHLASMAGIILVAACGKPVAPEVPVTAAPSGSACVVPHMYGDSRLDKNSEGLFSAAAAGDARRVEQLIEQGANVNVVGSLHRTPLFAAAFCDRPDVVVLLLKKGSNANAIDSNGMSSLHAAVIVGGTGAAKALIANGADINSLDASGRTPLHLAAATDQVLMVELLLEHKANVLAHDKRGMTAAALASGNGHSMPGVVIKKWREKPGAKQ